MDSTETCERCGCRGCEGACLKYGKPPQPVDMTIMGRPIVGHREGYDVFALIPSVYEGEPSDTPLTPESALDILERPEYRDKYFRDQPEGYWPTEAQLREICRRADLDSRIRMARIHRDYGIPYKDRAQRRMAAGVPPVNAIPKRGRLSRFIASLFTR